jgi:hypothetical protein
MPAGQRERLLTAMEAAPAADLRRLLRYDAATAGGLMTSQPLIVTPDTPVAEVLARIRNPDLPVSTGLARHWDPYPFILLNLAFSTQAAYAAPLILLAQNRQDDRDRASIERDREVAARTQADTEYLARELAAVRLALADVVTTRDLEDSLSRLAGLIAGRTPDKPGAVTPPDGHGTGTPPVWLSPSAERSGNPSRMPDQG